MWAAQLGSENILTAKIANDLGILAGASMVLSEFPSTAIEVVNDPVGYVTAITNLFGSILSDPVLITDIAANLPGTITDLQEMENPYDANNELYDDFESGWYSGYVSMSLATMYMGGEVTKSIKTSEQFVDATSGIASKLDDIGIVLKNSGSLAKTKIIYMLIDDTASAYLGGQGPRVAKAVSKMDISEVKTKQLVDDLQKVQVTKLAAVTDEDELCALLASSMDDGVVFTNNIDANSLNKLLSISSDKLESTSRGKMSGNLAKLYGDGTPIDEIESFIDDIDELKNVNGVDKLASRVTKDSGNFKGVKFEAEFAASGNVDDIVEMGAKTPKSVSTPGDIDLIRAEGSQNVAYELKNVDFANMDSNIWTKYQTKLSNQNTGLKNIVDNEIPINGKVINNYKFMFREQPPTYVTDWLDGQSIPYDVFL